MGRDNGTMPVLLDLTAAVATIDHEDLFRIFERYVGIYGKALKLINSYLLYSTQHMKLIMFCHMFHIFHSISRTVVIL